MGTGPQGFNSGLTEEQGEAVDSIIGLSDGEIPKGESGKLVGGGASADPSSLEWTFDKTINVPSASVNVGRVVTLSEGAEELLITSNISGFKGYAVVSDFNDSGSGKPKYPEFGPQFNIDLQPDDSAQLSDNPLIFNITGGVIAPNLRQTNQTTFRTAQPMNNVTSRITDVASGVVIKYVPDQAAWDNNTGGLDFIAGDNIVDFNSNEPSTPGIYNIGVSPFILSSGQQISIELRGDTMELLGSPTNFPYFTQRTQDGPQTELLDSNDYGELTSLINETYKAILIKQLGKSSTNADYDTNPQTLLSEVVNPAYDLAKVTFSFESSCTSLVRSSVIGLFIDGAVVDAVSDIEPKDSRNNSYQCKAFDYDMSSGPHTIEVKWGKGNGGGPSLAEVSNARIIIEEIRL